VNRFAEALAVLLAAIVFLTGVISPPSLMDDMDSVQAQIARTMLESGDWVTARLNGVAYLEKAPLKYWMIAASFAVFGVHDWAARLPLALTCIALCWLTARMGAWAFSPTAGAWAGVVLATSLGLWLFTRVQLTEAFLALAITLAIYSFVRALEPDEPSPRRWAWLLAVSLAAGLLFKGLTGVVFPLGSGFLYLALTKRLFARDTWRRLHPFTSAALFLAIAAPWHVLAILRNPPHFDFTLHARPGEYRGFFWFYFLNEHLLRYLNLRYPRDYNTVPRLQFWLLHLVWLFPWSAFLPALATLKYRPDGRAGRMRMMALIWTALVLLFFSFSTTQEYYTLPVYPAVALLIGCAVAAGPSWVGAGTRIVAGIAAAGAVALVAVLVMVWNTPAPGDIAAALAKQEGDIYTLSLGHMQDLTLRSMAYLKLPVTLAAVACIIGAAGGWRRSLPALALMMVVFFQAARLALIAFDPYLSSRPLAEALERAPRGRLIVDNQYYAFSSIFFYTNLRALLLNGRVNNLEYGSYAPGAPDVFIADSELPELWAGAQRWYLAAEGPAVSRIEALVGRSNLHTVAAAGGKVLFSNAPLH
jgi:4-amino-4-deoxy-L-arabinose transferase-like glycosyltransferase